MDQTTFIIIAVAAFLAYRAFKFIKRKIRWLIASLPFFVSASQVPGSKWSHLIALIT